MQIIHKLRKFNPKFKDKIGSESQTNLNSEVGNLIANVLDSLLLNEDEKKKIADETKEKVIDMCSKYPIYNEAY